MVPIDSLKRKLDKGFMKIGYKGNLALRHVTEFVTEQIDMDWYKIALLETKNLVKLAFYEVLMCF